MPTTMFFGRPQHFCSAHTMASSGLVMQMTKALRRVFLDAGADLIHHLEIDAEQIVAAHAGLARHAGGDDAHVGAFDALVGVGAAIFGVETFDRRGLRDVERLALRDALHDVEHHDVAQLLQTDEVGERAADLARADQCNLLARHGDQTSIDGAPRNRGRRWLNAKDSGFKPTLMRTAKRFACVCYYTLFQICWHAKTDLSLRRSNMRAGCGRRRFRFRRCRRSSRRRRGCGVRAAAPGIRPSASRSGARRCA